ncbi:MAG TPA: hypothetical protein VFI53_14650 [Myxococcaceae bacterium]|nr:hypothetical protein [Myxococcaceae bacterium]
MRLTLGRGFLAHHTIARLVLHALGAAVLSGVLLVLLDSMFQLPVASGLYLLAVPAVTALVAARYFRKPDAAEPLITAIWFTAVAGGIDLAMATIADGSSELAHPAIGFGLPLILVFGATGLTGELVPSLSRGSPSSTERARPSPRASPPRWR